MGMKYIRDTYGVPAKRGMRVRYNPPNDEPREGRIVGSEGARLRIQLDPRRNMRQVPTIHHPTWCLEYL
ncbi:MAG: hypothetical protein GY788_07395 [bacterium]|nr:hypothetical protein [bacterium]